MLSITEELFLLSLDDEKGKLVNCDSNVVRFDLAGAILFELKLRGEIEIKGREVVAWPTQPTGDPILDLAVERFAKKDQIKNLIYWVMLLARDFGKVRILLLERLVEAGALKKEEHTFLWAFKYNRYPLENARIEDRIRMRLRESLFGGGEIDSRDFILLALIGAAKMVAEVFNEEDVDEARRRIDELKGDDPIGPSVTQAVIDFESAL